MRLPPLHRQIVVSADPDRAFAVFTDQLGAWWPVAQFSVALEDTSVAFEGDRIVETTGSGAEHVWGEVTRWEPGAVVGFTWHPGHPDSAGSHVEVTFVAVSAERTLVTLVHSGWERLATPAQTREEYRNGWPLVVGRFAEVVGTDATTGDGPLWFVLSHTAASGQGAAAFDSELFGHHVGFLSELGARGWLVAAGPLPDAAGAGMTVVRVPASAAATLVDDAQHADGSVAGGLFDVEVRCWDVRFSSEVEDA